MAGELGVGTFSNPGAGFVLFWASLILGALSLFLVMKAVTGKSGSSVLSESWRWFEWWKVLAAIIALVLYASFLTRMGFLIMTLALMILLYSLGKTKPWVTLAGAFVTIMVAYIIFHIALQIQFPKGMIGW